MRYRCVPFLLLACMAWAGVQAPLRAQEFSPEGQKFWEQYEKARELGDQKAIRRLIVRDQKDAVEVFETLILYLCSPEYSGMAEKIQPLVKDLEEGLRTKRFSYRFELILNFSREERFKWLEAWNTDIDGFNAYLEGKKNDNPYKLDEALGKFKKSLASFESLKDADMAAKAIMHRAMTLSLLKEHYDACVAYKKALDLMKTLPFTHPDQDYVEAGLNQYLKKGYDPTKPRNEGGEPPAEGEKKEGAGKEGEGKKEGAQRAEFKPGARTETAVLKYAPMRSPDEFITPGYNTGYNPYLWPGTWFDARDNPSAKLEPYYGYGVSFYGKQINISRVKNKFFLDIDGNEKTRVEVKNVTKPYKVVLTDREKGPDGKPLRYQLFLQATGQQENMFGIEMNNAPDTIEAISLRVRTGCYTKGKVLGQNYILIDDNSDGVFGDFYYIASDFITYGDYIHWRPDAFLYGREKIARPFSRYQYLGDAFYKVEVDKFGRKLTVSEVRVETGTLRFVWHGQMEPVYVVLRLIDEKEPGTFFNVAGSKDPVVLPIGSYEIACGKIEEKKKHAARQIRIYHGTAKYIEIRPGEETTLELGAPFTFTFDTSYSGKNFVVKGKTVNVWGRSGELYTQFFDFVPQPLVSIRDKKTGKMLVKRDKMRLAEREDFYKDRYCQWHPLDYTFEFKKGTELEARLEAKSIKLLGGPVTSEWR